MTLITKTDFPQAQENWDRFWRGELGRPAIAAVVAKPGLEPAPKPAYTSGRDGDFAPLLDQLERYLATHEFIGEAIPFYVLEFAADHFSALLGAKLRFRDDGHGYGWTEPIVADWDDFEIRFRPEGEWWQRTVALAQALQERFAGRLLIAAPTLVANLDALAALRGTEALLMDLVIHPDKVHRALEQVTQSHHVILDALAELLDYETWGSLNRHGMYCRGRINVPQCDFSCMIGPDMYAQFVIPYLRQEMAHLDQVEYHLDGPGALKHLEALCSLERLDVVQWVPGAGIGEERDWTDLYQRIDDLGKGQIRYGDGATMQALWDRYQSPKLFWNLRAESRAQAEDVLASMCGR